MSAITAVPEGDESPPPIKELARVAEYAIVVGAAQGGACATYLAGPPERGWKAGDAFAPRTE